MVRGRIKGIHSTCCQIILSLLERCPLARVSYIQERDKIRHPEYLTLNAICRRLPLPFRCSSSIEVGTRTHHSRRQKVKDTNSYRRKQKSLLLSHTYMADVVESILSIYVLGSNIISMVTVLH